MQLQRTKIESPNRRLAGWLALAYVFAAIALGYAAVESSFVATRELDQAYREVEVTTAGDALGSIAGKVMDAFGSMLASIGLNGYREDKAAKVAALAASGATHRTRAMRFALLLVLISTAYCVALWIVVGAESMASHIATVAAVWFVVGLLAPTLTLTITHRLPMLGDVVLQHETKNILSVVGALWTSGNRPVSLLLVLCGIVLPAMKLLSLLMSRTLERSRLGLQFAKLAELIGPWAMTDVFSLAILVAFLVLGHGSHTGAQIEIGAYLFAGQCILALVSVRIHRVWRLTERAAEGHCVKALATEHPG